MSETHTLGTEAGATVDQGTCVHGQSDDDTCPECIREVVAACGWRVEHRARWRASASAPDGFYVSPDHWVVERLGGEWYRWRTPVGVPPRVFGPLPADVTGR